MEQIEQQPPATAPALPVISAEIVKQRMLIQLTKQELAFQALSNKAQTIVVNEDTVEDAKKFLENIRKAKKEIEDYHKKAKEPYLAGGKAVDAAKNDMLALFDNIAKPVNDNYTRVCAEIHRKEQERLAEIEHERQIRSTIESTVIEFSQKIASCDTREQLVTVQRQINLEKSASRSNKYGKFHAEAIARFDEVLLPILNAQKPIVEQKDALAAKITEAENAGDVDALDKLTHEHEVVHNTILDNQVRVQEAALNSSAYVPEVKSEQVFPTARPRRTEVTAEVTDMAMVFKKSPQLLRIELKVADAIAMGKNLIDGNTGKFANGKEEMELNGIKYSIKKTW